MRSNLPAALRLLACLAAAMAALAAADARADRIEARLQASAEVAIRCELDARVAPVGSSARGASSATVSVRCTKGAAVATVQCGAAACFPTAPSAEAPRYEYRVAEPGGETAPIATLLF